MWAIYPNSSWSLILSVIEQHSIQHLLRSDMSHRCLQLVCSSHPMMWKENAKESNNNEKDETVQSQSDLLTLLLVFKPWMTYIVPPYNVDVRTMPSLHWMVIPWPGFEPWALWTTHFDIMHWSPTAHMTIAACLKHWVSPLDSHVRCWFVYSPLSTHAPPLFYFKIGVGEFRGDVSGSNTGCLVLK